MQKDILLEKLKAGGFSEEIIKAFAEVDREEFVPDEFKIHAYDNIPIPLGETEASISPPTTIATMLQLLDVKKTDSVLEIGSGSGYVLALLAKIAPLGNIYGVEINTKLATDSRKRLTEHENVHIFNLDGSKGFPQQASQSQFDKIILSASAPDIGTVYQMLDQLKEDGILVAPVKDSIVQIKKTDRKIEKHEFPGFAFVKLIKKEF